MTFHISRILASQAPRYLAVGWREVARERVPSVDEPIVIVRYDGDRAPPPLSEAEIRLGLELLASVSWTQ